MSREKKELIDDLNKYKKDKSYSKKAVIYGGVGLVASVADYIISSNLGIDSMLKSFQDMNTHEIVANLTFGISSMGVLGGGLIYGLSSFFENEDKKEIKDKLKPLEEKVNY